MVDIEASFAAVADSSNIVVAEDPFALEVGMDNNMEEDMAVVGMESSFDQQALGNMCLKKRMRQDKNILNFYSK